MSESDIWSVDRIAANNLAVDLDMIFEPEQIERIADHFSRHRLSAAQWAAERMHARIVTMLESESMRLAQEHDEDWTQGYMRAEQVVMTMPAENFSASITANRRAKARSCGRWCGRRNGNKV
jgi:nicotinamide riboside kinase